MADYDSANAAGKCLLQIDQELSIVLPVVETSTIQGCLDLGKEQMFIDATDKIVV